MSNEIKEIIEYFKDDIDYLEEELKYSNFKGRYITIRDKECEYLRKLLDYITNLQEEIDELKADLYEANDSATWWNNRYNAIVKQNDDNHKKFVKEQEENERLKELCNKYEEEHKTTFKLWKKDLKNFEHEKNRELKSRITKAIEFIEEELTFYITIGGTNERKLIGYNKAFDELLKILQGNKWNEVEKAYLDDKPIGSDKE